jgi:hypothetical protein
MFSRLKPGFVYSDISSDITENDLDVVADTWDMDGREVYRGTRDPRYTHATVHWLYDDNLERVGCVEHDLQDHAKMQVLWFRDSEFGTLLQEDWTVGDDLWSKLPRHVFDRFLNEGWTTPASFLENCLQGPLRIVTPSMLVTLPNVYTCSKCGKRSLKDKDTCETTMSVLDFPDKEKVFFIDFDFIVHTPPSDSFVWSRLLQRPHAGGSSGQVQVQEEQLAYPPQTAPRSPPALPHPPPSADPAAESVQQ